MNKYLSACCAVVVQLNIERSEHENVMHINIPWKPASHFSFNTFSDCYGSFIESISMKILNKYCYCNVKIHNETNTREYDTAKSLLIQTILR